MTEPTAAPELVWSCTESEQCLWRGNTELSCTGRASPGKRAMGRTLSSHHQRQELLWGLSYLQDCLSLCFEDFPIMCHLFCCLYPLAFHWALLFQNSPLTMVMSEDLISFFFIYLFFIYWPRAEQKARFWVRALVMVLLCSRKWDPLDDVSFSLNVIINTFQKPCATSNTWPDSWVLSAAQWPWFYGGLTQMFKKFFAVQRAERWGTFYM